MLSTVVELVDVVELVEVVEVVDVVEVVEVDDVVDVVEEVVDEPGVLVEVVDVLPGTVVVVVVVVVVLVEATEPLVVVVDFLTVVLVDFGDVVVVSSDAELVVGAFVDVVVSITTPRRAATSQGSSSMALTSSVLSTKSVWTNTRSRSDSDVEMANHSPFCPRTSTLSAAFNEPISPSPGHTKKGTSSRFQVGELVPSLFPNAAKAPKTTKTPTTAIKITDRGLMALELPGATAPADAVETRETTSATNPAGACSGLAPRLGTSTQRPSPSLMTSLHTRPCSRRGKRRVR